MKDREFVLDKKIKVKSEDHIYHLHQYGVDLLKNHIYLMGVDRGYEVTEGTDEPGVDFVMANMFIKNMQMCMSVNPGVPILIHQATCGGEWHAGMAIYDSIKTCPSPVTILNYTHARSMSSIILQSANKRVTMPHGVFMFHDGDVSLYGTVKQVESNVDFYKIAGIQMRNIYVESMREKEFLKNDSQRKKWLNTKMNQKEDVFLTPVEAIEAGFIDEVFNGNWKTLTEDYTPEQLQR